MLNFTTRFTVSLLLLVLPAAIIGQDVVSGTILGSDKTPIVGAYIVHTASEKHSHSNESGFFSIEGVAAGDVLKFMHLGHRAKEVLITDVSVPLKIVLEEANYDLSEVLVGQNRKDVNIISRIDLAKAPVNSSQEVLRKVPGLFIGQHAGGGKAEQIFLRGFDIDHGTDINISVDGLPVNMVSHAHGQGYADLHFIIPETIEKIDFGKGPYYADRGNFATAGYVDFRLKEKVDESFIGLELGQFNTIKNAALLNLLSTDNHNLYLAGEYLSSDGPFLSPQDFRRTNALLKYTVRFDNLDKLSVLVSRFDSKWNASGQIPQRAVESGLITRFGAIDDTEGGETSRTNVLLSYNKTLTPHALLKNRVYYTHYDFHLISNFTFFLNDPINADQIRQRESRDLFGIESEMNYSFGIGSSMALLQTGIGLRSDLSNGNELSRTRNRTELISPVQLGNVEETNLYGYINMEMEFGNLLINPGLRIDRLDFNYEDHLAPTFSVASDNKIRVSPKLNFIYNTSPTLQLYLKTGIGFHSNDTRIVLNRPEQGYLPQAYGADIGALWKPTPRLLITSALWYLHSDQEFVYVGDEGVVEPSGQSGRMGIDLGTRFQAKDWLYFDADLNLTRARSLEENEGNDYIPLAAPLTSMGSANIQLGGFTGSIRYRYLGDRPANEDKSIIAPGYLVTDASIVYRWKSLQLGLTFENIFNVEWNEAQFATESRLMFENSPVEEIHFTPGTPRFFKASMRYNF